MAIHLGHLTERRWQLKSCLTINKSTWTDQCWQLKSWLTNIQRKWFMSQLKSIDKAHGSPRRSEQNTSVIRCFLFRRFQRLEDCLVSAQNVKQNLWNQNNSSCCYTFSPSYVLKLNFLSNKCNPSTIHIHVTHPHLVEDVLESLLCEGGALHILHSPQLFRQPLSHLQAQRLLLVLCWKTKSAVENRLHLPRFQNLNAQR